MLSRRYAARAAARSSVLTSQRDLSMPGAVAAVTAFTVVATRRPILSIGVGAMTAMAFATVLCYEEEESARKNKSGSLVERRQQKQADGSRARKSSDDADLQITMDNIEKTWEDAKDVAFEAWKEAREVGRVLTRVVSDVGSEAVDRYVDHVDEDDDLTDKAKVLGAVVARSAVEVKDQMKDKLQLTEEQQKALDSTLKTAKKSLISAKDQAARMASSAKDTLENQKEQWQQHDFVDNVKRTTSDAAEFVQEKGQEAVQATNKLLRDNDLDDIPTAARKAKDAAYDKGAELKSRAQEYLDENDMGDVKSAARKAKNAAVEKGTELKDRTQEYLEDHDMGDVKSAARRTKNFAAEKGQQLRNRADEMLRDYDMDDTAAAAQKARDTVADKARNAKETAGRGLSRGKEKAKEFVADTQIKAEDTASDVKQWWYQTDNTSADDDSEGIKEKAYRGARYTQEKAGEAYDAAADKAQELKDAASRNLSRGKRKAKHLAADAQDKAEDAASDAKQWWYTSDNGDNDGESDGIKEKAYQSARYAKEKAGDAYDAAADKAREFFGNGNEETRRSSKQSDSMWSRMEDPSRFK